MSQVEWEWDHHRICSESTFIKQDKDHQNGLYKHVILTQMSIKKAYFLQKKCALTQNAESGIFRCYSQLAEPSNYSARIVYIDLLNIKATPLKI